MKVTQEISMTSAAIAQPAAAARTAVRLTYLDGLRAILITLVIALHTAITYGAIGDWTFVDPAESEITGILLTFVTTIVQAFSLGLYFFLSGYFTPGSYDRKGIGAFWKDRLLRLGIPMIVYTFALSRIPTYFGHIGRGEDVGTFWQYFARTFITGADEGPTWFIFALLLFLVGYTLVRLLSKGASAEKSAWIKNLKVPGKLQILGLGVVVGVLMFVVGLFSTINDTVAVFGIFNLMTIFFVQYILFFIAGILAFRNDWISRFNGKDMRFWSWLTLGLFLVMPVLFYVGVATDSVDFFVGGPYWQAAAFMLWIGLFSVSISMTLILWLRGRQQHQGRLLTFAGPNSYGVYLIHPLILVPLSVLLAPISMHPLLKFVVVLPVVVILCFLVTAGLRRIPGLKAIL